MKAAANIAGHPIHPIVVTVPIGLWSFALVADVMYLWRGNPAWIWVAYYCLGAGCLGAIAAAAIGLIDLLGVKDKGAFHAASVHAAVNVITLVIFAVDFYLRTQRGSAMLSPDSRIPLILSFVGVASLLTAGWLGGELVYRYGLGVNDRHGGLPSEGRID